MTTSLAIIFVFGIIVLVHELGHFITAKLAGMRVDEFAIGFGPALVSYKYGETLYSIRIIPLGGFNKIAGMDPEEETDGRGFSDKSVFKRLVVISAGAIMNFLLAILLFWGILVGAGIQEVSNQPIIGKIEHNSPAQIAHLEQGDKIISINGKAVNIWSDIAKNLKNEGAKNIPLKIERANKVQEIWIIPKNIDKDRAIIGVYPVETSKSVGLFEGLKLSIEQTGNVIAGMVFSLKMMITGKAAAEVSGPVGVAQMVGQVAQFGIVPLLSFTALLSINLGVINLLPVPALDGGHIIILLIEAITGRKISKKVLVYIQVAGLFILGSLFLYATFNDITKLL